MTDLQYRLDVTTSDGKYTVRQMQSGATTALRDGKPWRRGCRMVTNLELALAYDLADARAKLVEIDASEVLPIESAPKDGRILQLLVRYDRDAECDDHPLDDEAWERPGWTIGFNTLGDTGEDCWRMAGWCWSHDHFTEGNGTPVGWLPFHGLPMDDEPLPGFLSDVIAERIRQIQPLPIGEGRSPEHDDQYVDGALALAASCYADPVPDMMEGRDGLPRGRRGGRKTGAPFGGSRRTAAAISSAPPRC